jgi:ligand-binding sensor domain-containing protein
VGIPWVLAALLPAAPVQALAPGKAITQYRRDVWLPKDGLPQSSVDSMVQTRDGYLWFGTQEGLARFDGVRFVVFDKKNVPEIRHNRILSLLADRSGTLWAEAEGPV